MAIGMRSRPSGGDFLNEVLDALGIRDPLWQRELISETELLSITRDRRELARVLDRIARMDGVLVHVRNTKNGRYWFLEKSGTTCVTGMEKGMAVRSCPPRQGVVPEAPEELSPEEEEATSLPASDATAVATPRPVTGASGGYPGRKPSTAQLREDGQSAALRRAIEDVGVHVDHVDPVPLVGPTVTRYRVYLTPGERIRHLRRRSEDLARGLGSTVFVTQVPGERCVAIDLPRKDRQVVSLASALAQFPLTDNPAALWLPIGISPAGEPVFLDLTLLPHILLAGGTGSGKSVWLRSALLSLVLGGAPSDLEILLVDPKSVDYAPFAAVPHLRGGHIITEPEEAIELLQELTESELARRTQLLQHAGCSNFRELRARHPETGARYLVVVIDEYADLGLSLEKAERAEFERQVVRLAQRGRAAGIFLILATQRPSVDLITGRVKANLPTRISFRLPQRVDSQLILDEPGAEDLLGAGDLLLLHEGCLQRLQGFFLSTEEITKLIDDRITKRGFNDEAQH